MLTGALATLVLKEGKQRTLEDLSNEKQEGFIEGSRMLRRATPVVVLTVYILGTAYSEVDTKGVVDTREGDNSQ